MLEPSARRRHAISQARAGHVHWNLPEERDGHGPCAGRGKGGGAGGITGIRQHTNLEPTWDYRTDRAALQSKAARSKQRVIAGTMGPGSQRAAGSCSPGSLSRRAGLLLLWTVAAAVAAQEKACHAVAAAEGAVANAVSGEPQRGNGQVNMRAEAGMPSGLQTVGAGAAGD